MPCCDLHGRNCEPPSELCCAGCTEAAHRMSDAVRGFHADGSVCSNPDLSGGFGDPAEPRELAGRYVRQAWVEWAREQPDPKASWLLPWEELDDGQREVDMRIGAALFEARPSRRAPRRRDSSTPRLGGGSRGATLETDVARRLGIPTHSVGELIGGTMTTTNDFKSLSPITISAINAATIHAQVKHGDRSYLGNSLTTTERLAGLMEEVGEVARALTYDGGGRDGEHPGDKDKVVKELLQVASVAACWAEWLDNQPPV